MTRHATSLLLALALLASACGSSDVPTVDPGRGAAPDEPDSDGSGSDEAATVVADLPACVPWDAPREYTPPPEEQPPTDPAITSPEHFEDIAIAYGEDVPDHPDGASTEMAAWEAATTWAQREAPDHFVGTWIDPEHHAAVIAFTDDVERYAEEVRDRFGAGWWVVEAPFSEAELEAAHEQVMEAMGATGLPTPPGAITSSGTSPDRGQVFVEVVGGDDQILADLAAELDHPAICFDVLPPPPEPDDDGPVRTLATVEGWREALEGESDIYARLEIAYDRETGEQAFADNVPDDLPAGDGDPWEDGLHADLGTVDWDREVIAVYTGGRSGSCPEWVTGVLVEAESVRLEMGSPSQGVCTSDYNGFRTVVAIDRGRVPEPDALPMPANDGFPETRDVVLYPDEAS